MVEKKMKRYSFVYILSELIWHAELIMEQTSGVVQRNLLDPILGAAAKRREKAAGVRGVSHT